MPAQDVEFLAASGVPDPHRLVPGPQDNARPVRTDRNRVHLAVVPAEDGQALVELRVQVVPLPASELRGRLIEQITGATNIVGLKICKGTSDAGQVGLAPGLAGCLFRLLLLFLRIVACEYRFLTEAALLTLSHLCDVALLGFFIPGDPCLHQPNARARDSSQQDHE